MLLIARHVGERIVLAGGIEIVVQKIGRSSVKLAVRAPAGVQVLRGEVWDAVARENQAAALAPLDDDALVALATAAPVDEAPVHTALVALATSSVRDGAEDAP
jgi:carbon storage regulator